jgi:hypothetical protein
MINSHVVSIFECRQDSEPRSAKRPRGHTPVIVIQVGETEGKRTAAGIHAAGVPNVEVRMGSKLPYHIGQAHEAWR